MRNELFELLCCRALSSKEEAHVFKQHLPVSLSFFCFGIGVLARAVSKLCIKIDKKLKVLVFKSLRIIRSI